MKTIVTIENYDGSLARQRWCDDLDYFTDLHKSPIYSNDEYTTLTKKNIEYIEKAPDGYKTIIARGYDQGEYIEFYAKDPDEDLQEHLEKIFTHKNDYYITAKQVNEDGREKPIELDYNHIDIDGIEFPLENDIVREIEEIGLLVGYSNIEYVFNLS